MERVASWVGLVIFVFVPLYFMLRFRWRGLFLSVLVLWLAFGILSEFFPLCRPGWEPLRHPASFVVGYIVYATPFAVIYGLKELIAPTKREPKPDAKKTS